MKKQKIYSSQFKADAVLESYITGNVAATANRNRLHESVLRRWRKQFRKNIAKIFTRGKAPQQKEVEGLEKIIGRLTIEKEILKKTMDLIN